MRAPLIGGRRRAVAIVVLAWVGGSVAACLPGGTDDEREGCIGEAVILFEALQLGQLELSPVIEVVAGRSIVVTVTHEVDQGLMSDLAGPVVRYLPAGDQPDGGVDEDGVTRYHDPVIGVTGLGKPATLDAEPGSYQLYSRKGVTLRIEQCEPDE